jgi:hypothetical protein
MINPDRRNEGSEHDHRRIATGTTAQNDAGTSREGGRSLVSASSFLARWRCFWQQPAARQAATRFSTTCGSGFLASSPSPLSRPLITGLIAVLARGERFASVLVSATVSTLVVHYVALELILG